MLEVFIICLVQQPDSGRVSHMGRVLDALYTLAAVLTRKHTGIGGLQDFLVALTVPIDVELEFTLQAMETVGALTDPHCYRSGSF